MAQIYNLYAGLGGGFGGMQYHYTEEFDTREEAVDAAYQIAREDYESYEGLYGLMSWTDIKEEYCHENGLTEDQLTDEDYQMIDMSYEDELESWLSYAVTTVEEDPDHDRW